jgi:hypothetical protein
MCVVSIAYIIYTNDIEAEKSFEIGSYPGKAPPYNEIIVWSNGLKRPSVNLEHTKYKFADVINSICNGSLVLKYCKYVHLCSPLFLNIVHTFTYVHHCS